jgi:hypothetical protein
MEKEMGEFHRAFLKKSMTLLGEYKVSTEPIRYFFPQPVTTT